MRGQTLRFRMMVLFAVIVAVLLAASDVAFYLMVSHAVMGHLNRELDVAAAPLVRELTSEVNGRAVRELDAPGEYFQILDRRGRVLEQSRSLRGRVLQLPAGRSLPVRRPAYYDLFDAQLGHIRVALIPVDAGMGPVVLSAAMATLPSELILRKLRAIGILLWCLSVLVTLGVSALYVGRSLAPIRELTRHATETSVRVGRSGRGALWTPLAVRDPPSDLDRLADTFNQLFARVERVLRQLRQFVSDASHELRTPLSVLQGETELVLAAPRTVAEYQRTLRVIDGQLKKLNRIVEGLFTLSMADAGELRLVRSPLYLNEVLEETCLLVDARAARRRMRIRRELTQAVSFSGDEAFLQQLFLVFLDNAIKYSPADTEIAVSLLIDPERVRVRFQDQGIGVSPGHREHIFERFYRVAAGGSAGSAGSGGLGLAIAQAIARAHDGTVECESEEAVGSVFTVSLPLHPADRAPPGWAHSRPPGHDMAQESPLRGVPAVSESSPS